MSGENILEVQNLTKHFKISGKQIVHAVDGVSFTFRRGRHSDWSARVRLRKIDLCADGYPDVRCDRREDPSGGKGYYQSEAEGTETSAEKYADDLSGSVRFA